MENQDEVASTVKYPASAEKVGNGQFLSFLLEMLECYIIISDFKFFMPVFAY